MKIGLSISEELLERIDEYCEANFLTRSGFIAKVATDWLNAHEDLPKAKANLGNMLSAGGDFMTGKISKEEFSDILDQIENSTKAMLKRGYDGLK